MPAILAIALALQSAAPAPAPADYSMEQNWICHPGRRDTCSELSYDATVLAPGAAPRTEPFAVAEDPAFDCFYVYPTVSLDTAVNSDLVINDEERYVVEAQAARFGSVCRVFAPLYQQHTLPALRARMTGQELPVSAEDSREIAYQDVKAAWDHYLEVENQGRPYVIYGHSQGTNMLKRLLSEEIEGKPVAGRMLSALLLGINVGVTPGGDTGEFQTPLCREEGQTGCFVTFVTFSADDPPGANAIFGRWRGDEGYTVACTNPASLGSMGPAPAGSAYPTRRNDELPVQTPVLATPGLYTAQCVAGEGGVGYLALAYEPTGTPMDQLADGLLASTRGMPGWGLHMVDANVAQDDLIRLVAAQAAAYAAR
ncbi:MAG: DUF3089 domain-containing protein [Pacificimonas sp.]|jgi:hypothetical protein|nr:DUF3089 domain-containing protein [Pacificimonas sp.]